MNKHIGCSRNLDPLLTENVIITGRTFAAISPNTGIYAHKGNMTYLNWEMTYFGKFSNLSKQVYFILLATG